MVFPMFLLFTGMILETGWRMFQQATLDNAVLAATRLIRTGQIQSGGGSMQPLTDVLCSHVGTTIPCSSLQVNVTSAATFTSLSGTPVTDSIGTLISPSFTPGGAGQDVVVQVVWARPNLVPFLGPLLQWSGVWLMTSTVAFRNEQYL